MNSGPGVLYTVHEAAEMTDCSPATLRHWERQGLVHPRRSPAGFRLYDERDLLTLRRAMHLRRVQKLSLATIRRVLQQSTTGAPAAGPDRPARQVAIGPRLRRLRLEQGRTLQAVAEATGLSHSFLSLLERGRTGVAVATLHRILHVYGTTLAALAASPGRHDVGWLTRADRRPTLSGQFTGTTIQQLSTMPASLDPSLFTVEPGAGSEGAYSHEGEEFLFVLAGVFDVILGGGRRYRLRTGDSLHYPSSVEHEWANPGPGTARILWVNTPPTF